MPSPASIPALPGRVNPGEDVRADDWNRLLAVVFALVAQKSPVRPDAPDPVRAALLAEDVMLGRVAELKAPARVGVANWPSATRYVFVAVHAAGIVLDERDAQGNSVGVVPDYGRPVFGDEARLYPQAVGSPVLLLRQRDAGSPGGVRTYACVLDERVARRRCGAGGG